MDRVAGYEIMSEPIIIIIVIVVAIAAATLVVAVVITPVYCVWCWILSLSIGGAFSLRAIVTWTVSLAMRS